MKTYKRMREKDDNFNTKVSRSTSKISNLKESINKVDENELCKLPLREVYHYPSSLTFPVLLTPDFPAEPYRSRNKDIKSAIHWGQRKLLLSEIQLLSRYCARQTSYHIVYAGSAPGTHLGFLDDMFDSVHTWELIDPGQFNAAVLSHRPNFTLRNEFFTNTTAYGIIARCLLSVTPALGAVYSFLTIGNVDPLQKAIPPSTGTDMCESENNYVNNNDNNDDNNINKNNNNLADVKECNTCRVMPDTEEHMPHNAVNMSSRQRMSELHAQLQSKVGTLNVARGTVDIPSMYEDPLRLPWGIELLCHVALEERHKPLLFISDIRSGSVELDNFEEHVLENMRAQECWTNILHASYSMLKFRLPYTTKATEHGGRGEVTKSKLIQADGTVRYLRGDILLPIWTRPTSTEGRLVVRQGAFQTSYNVAHVENQFFFFNARVREQIHFNHILDKDALLDHHYDAAAEVECLKHYLQFKFPEFEQITSVNVTELAKRIQALSEHITVHLKVTFADVIRRRESILLKYAQQKTFCIIDSNSSNKNAHQIENNESICEGKRHALESKNSSAHHTVEVSNETKYGSENGTITTNTMKDKNGSNKKDTINCKDDNYCYRKLPVTDSCNSWESCTREMIRTAALERNRSIWKCNVDEKQNNNSSGLWVTTKVEEQQ